MGRGDHLTQIIKEIAEDYDSLTLSSDMSRFHFLSHEDNSRTSLKTVCFRLLKGKESPVDRKLFHDFINTYISWTAELL